MLPHNTVAQSSTFQIVSGFTAWVSKPALVCSSQEDCAQSRFEINADRKVQGFFYCYLIILLKTTKSLPSHSQQQ